LNETDEKKRAQKVLDNAKKLGVETYIVPKDICAGHSKLNVLFAAEIFNHCHGLDPLSEEEAYEAAKLLQDDPEGSREERAFRMWINSMNIDGLYCNNLYEDSKSGVMLLKLIDKVKPGNIEWKHVDLTSNNHFKKAANCVEAINASKKAGLNIVSVGGKDINEGNKKLILAVVWQLMREHTLQVIGNKNEKDLLDWANGLVGGDTKITSLQDKSLKTSLFWIKLEAAMEPRAINWDIINQTEDTDEALENNAKYCLSIARKLGATVFIVWEDLKEVKARMLLTFLAGLYDVHLALEVQKKDKSKNK